LASSPPGGLLLSIPWWLCGRIETSNAGGARRRFAASLASEKEERLPDRSLRAPVSMVPALASDVVSRVEELGHEDVAEGADGEERGGFHFHDDRPLRPPRLDLGTRLAEDGVGRPGLAEQVRIALALEHLSEDLETEGIRRHLAAGREVVIRGALVTNRGGGNDDLPQGDRRIEHPGAAAKDDHSGAMSDRPLEQTRRQGRPGARMKDGDAALAIGDLI